jgi:hypothetical protein
MSKQEPFQQNGDSNGAVPAALPLNRRRPMVCACCGESIPDDVPVDVLQDGSLLIGLTPRGRAAMVLCIDGFEERVTAILDYADAQRLVEAFSKTQDLKCARYAQDDL